MDTPYRVEGLKYGEWDRPPAVRPSVEPEDVLDKAHDDAQRSIAPDLFDWYKKGRDLHDRYQFMVFSDGDAVGLAFEESECECTFIEGALRSIDEGYDFEKEFKE